MNGHNSIGRSLVGERPSALLQCDNIEDLPNETIFHIMSFCTYAPSKHFAWQYEILCERCPKEDFTIKDVSSIFKTFSLVSKTLHECCNLFCQSNPIWIDEEWPSKYKVIAFLCKKKTKISSLEVTDLVDNPLRASLFLYLLQECDLSELKSLSMCNTTELRRYDPYALKALYEQHNYNLWYALDAGIPRSIFDQERKLRNTYQGRNIIPNREMQFHILLEELLLEGICQSIRNANAIAEIWLQVDRSSDHILQILESCPNLQYVNLKYGLGDTTQDFLERFTTAISKQVNLTSLHIESNGFNHASFSISSPSIEKLILSMSKVTINQINCPNLTRLDMKVLGFGETILSKFSLPKLECLILDLEEWTRRRDTKSGCIILSKFIATIPNLKKLDFQSDHKVELHLPKVKLRLESNSIQEIDATSHSTVLTFTGIKCPNLKKLSVKRKYEGMAWHCHVEEEIDLFDAGYDKGKSVRGDFNLKTLHIPNNCLIYIS